MEIENIEQAYNIYKTIEYYKENLTDIEKIKINISINDMFIYESDFFNELNKKYSDIIKTELAQLIKERIEQLQYEFEKLNC